MEDIKKVILQFFCLFCFKSLTGPAKDNQGVFKLIQVKNKIKQNVEIQTRGNKSIGNPLQFMFWHQLPTFLKWF